MRSAERHVHVKTFPVCPVLRAYFNYGCALPCVAKALKDAAAHLKRYCLCCI